MQVIFDALPLRVLPGVVMGALVYFMCGLQAGIMLFFHFLLVLILFNLVTSLVCLTISALIRRNSLANLAAIIVLLVMALFQGALLNIGALTSPRFATWLADPPHASRSAHDQSRGAWVAGRRHRRTPILDCMADIPVTLPLRPQLTHGQRV